MRALLLGKWSAPPVRSTTGSAGDVTVFWSPWRTTSSDKGSTIGRSPPLWPIDDGSVIRCLGQPFKTRFTRSLMSPPGTSPMPSWSRLPSSTNADLLPASFSASGARGSGMTRERRLWKLCSLDSWWPNCRKVICDARGSLPIWWREACADCDMRATGRRCLRIWSAWRIGARTSFGNGINSSHARQIFLPSNAHSEILIFTEGYLLVRGDSSACRRPAYILHYMDMVGHRQVLHGIPQLPQQLLNMGPRYLAAVVDAWLKHVHGGSPGTALFISACRRPDVFHQVEIGIQQLPQQLLNKGPFLLWTNLAAHGDWHAPVVHSPTPKPVKYHALLIWKDLSGRSRRNNV